MSLHRRAARACAEMASSEQYEYPGEPCESLEDAIDTCDSAGDLAWEAFIFALRYCRTDVECWAEAECLLREGWIPEVDR